MNNKMLMVCAVLFVGMSLNAGNNVTDKLKNGDTLVIGSKTYEKRENKWYERKAKDSHHYLRAKGLFLIGVTVKAVVTIADMPWGKGYNKFKKSEKGKTVSSIMIACLAGKLMRDYMNQVNRYVHSTEDHEYFEAE